MLQNTFDKSVHGMSTKQDWGTPQYLVDWCADHILCGGVFDMDACATRDSAKAEKFLSKEDDSFSKSWDGNVWCNPPYNEVNKWVQKAVQEMDCNPDRAKSIVMLIAARPDTRAWADYIWPYASCIIFLSGRIKFIDSSTGEESYFTAPFPSAIVHFNTVAYNEDIREDGYTVVQDQSVYNISIKEIKDTVHIRKCLRAMKEFNSLEKTNLKIGYDEDDSTFNACGSDAYTFCNILLRTSKENTDVPVDIHYTERNSIVSETELIPRIPHVEIKQTIVHNLPEKERSILYYQYVEQCIREYMRLILDRSIGDVRD